MKQIRLHQQRCTMNGESNLRTGLEKDNRSKLYFYPVADMNNPLLHNLSAQQKLV